VTTTTTGSRTFWEHGRLDARGGGKQLMFGRMYEDAAIEHAAFRPGGRIFCIASAGCMAIQLAPHHDEVVAVDINPVQLAYAERRSMGGSSVRGAAERFLALARAFAPLVGWRRSRVRAFLELDDPRAQVEFFRRTLDTARFRFAADTLLSRTVLRLFYAAPLREVLPRRLGPTLRGRLLRTFARHGNRANPYARALLLGELPREKVPQEAARIRFVHADAALFLEGQPDGCFDGFKLSNILDGASAGYADRLLAAVRRTAAPGARLVLRSFREPDGEMAAANMAAEDRAILWGIVEVRSAEAP